MIDTKVNFENDVNKVVCGDAKDFLKIIPDNSIDLIITDPPYGINYRFINNKKILFDKLENDDKDFDIGIYANELYRVLKNNSACYIFTRWDVYPKWFNKLKMFDIKNCIVWDKMQQGAGGLVSQYGYSHELIMYLSKGKHALRGKRVRDIFNIKKVRHKEKIGHPTQKPISLIYKLIQKSSLPNDIVLDCFMGSWTTAIACLKSNRNFIGCEKSMKFCKMGKERIKQNQVLFHL